MYVACMLWVVFITVSASNIGKEAASDFTKQQFETKFD